MARPKSSVKKYRLSAYLRKPIYDEVIALLEDPLAPGSIPYGEFSKYVNRLIAEDLRKLNLIGEDSFNKILISIEKGT